MAKDRWRMDFEYAGDKLGGFGYHAYLLVESKAYGEGYRHRILRAMVYGTTGNWNCLIRECSCWVPGVEFPPECKTFETLRQAELWVRMRVRQRNKEHRAAMDNFKKNENMAA